MRSMCQTNIKWTIIFYFIVLFEICTISCCYYNETRNNPCSSKQCSLGTECTVSADGRKAQCICPSKCPSYGDSRGSRLVCGSDGRDYPNLCELHRFACTKKEDIFVRYNGSCDPCYGVKCPTSQICQIDEHRYPICKCNAACGKNFEPVCGSDGNTYINECILRVEACRSVKSLRILHYGACAETNACKSLKCSNYHECEVNRFGIAICQCPSSCSKILKPVCGTDGNTYDSECHLKQQACIQHKKITIRYIGLCDSESFCHKNHGICKYGSVCAVHKNTNYTCLCPQCPQNYAPVCGSNGITYINDCKFREDMCQKKFSNITFHEGACVGCESVNCQFYSRCESTKNGGKCVCPFNCEKVYDPVCGSDLVTYSNECELRVNSCKKREYITAIKRGPCNSCHNVHCDYGARCENGICVCPKKCPAYIEPVCGSNNITYDNQCKLMSASCDSVTRITVQSKGSCVETAPLRSADIFSTLCEYNTCKYGGICIIDNKSNNHCFCNFNCSYSRTYVKKICGNDGRFYENECVLQEEMCNRQQDIERQDPSFCENYLNVPCQGELPLINPETKKEYSCHRSKCPVGSYCHKGNNFAKCCQEIDLDEDCSDTNFGCCPDGRTIALGPNEEGCPSTCQCNRLGSHLSRCDAKTNQCFCKQGVGGLHCERCEPGFWGLHKISEGNAGCISCQCNQIGSSRDDCEQMTGRCVCKPGFEGMKCDICSTKFAEEFSTCTFLGSNLTTSNIVCSSDINCQYGATCVNYQCVCSFECFATNNSLVCASDGNIYESECHLKQLSCKIQKPLSVVSFDKCRSTTLKQSATTSPVRRSTEYQNYDKMTKHASVSALTNTGPTIPTIEQEEVNPSDSESCFFDGSSFIELDTMKAYSKVHIQIKFVSFGSDGIILYNGQTNHGEGDFIALLLKNAFVELRFNLGSGTVTLKSSKPINLGQTLVIEVYRHLSEAFLSIDQMDNVTGKSDGPHKLLDLGQNLFVGGLSLSTTKRIFDTLGTKKNFTGCIQLIEVNQQKIELKEENSVNMVNVGSCNLDSCSKVFCHDRGVCLIESNSYSCVCNNDFNGTQCETKKCLPFACTDSLHQPSILNFQNNAYVQLPTLTNVSQAFVIEIWFMTRSPNGLIMYNGQTQGDFIELLLEDSFLFFNFNLGGKQNKSLVSIRSSNQLSLGHWHRVLITRKLKQGMLQIDDLPGFEDAAKGTLYELNLDKPFYIGGMRDSSDDNDNSIMFDGAIQRVAINGIILSNILNKSIDMHNIQEYDGPPCGYENFCMNQGRCIPFLNEYLCQCQVYHQGSKCEFDISSNFTSAIIVDNIQVISSNRDSPLIRNHQNLIELKLKTKDEDGLILWTSSNKANDYLAIVMVNGFLEISFDLGKQSHYNGIRSSIRINDGAFHTVLFLRNKQIGILEVDGKYMTSGVSESGASVLNTDDQLWIGGSTTIASTLPKSYHKNFQGCLDYIKIDGIFVLNSTNILHGCSTIDSKFNV